MQPEAAKSTPKWKAENSHNEELLRANPYCDVLEYKSTAADHFIKDKHENQVNGYQKPLLLYQNLLQCYVHPGATVIDGAMGTGSLELAAMGYDVPEGLSFLSFENNSYQAQEAALRLEKSCRRPTTLTDMLLDINVEERRNAPPPLEVVRVEVLVPAPAVAAPVAEEAERGDAPGADMPDLEMGGGEEDEAAAADEEAAAADAQMEEEGDDE